MHTQKDTDTYFSSAFGTFVVNRYTNERMDVMQKPKYVGHLLHVPGNLRTISA